MKENIRNLDLNEIKDYFETIGDKKFRATQLVKWLYENNIQNFDEITNFSKNLRLKLSEDFYLNSLTLEDRKISEKDSTEKFLFRTRDDNFIESVILKNYTDDSQRITFCISSQVGCAMGCSFCNTAKLGIIRDLEVAEILDQISLMRFIIGQKNNNIVFMGMGEPFLNYDNVIKAAGIINSDYGFNISNRKITISTCGILPEIEEFINSEEPYNLAISLNDTLHEKRVKNMPVEKKYPIKDIAKFLNDNYKKTKGRVTLEYVMRKDNISKEDARRIKQLFPKARIKLNLIPLNTGGLENKDVPDKKDIEKFINNLEIINIPISIRKSLGQDIDGACGQLSGKKYKK